MNFYREILALRVKKKIKLISVYLHQFSSDKIINHFKHSVRMFLPALHEHEKRQFEKVKEAYLEYKQRYFRHLIKHRETGVRHAIPTEFLSLSYSREVDLGSPSMVILVGKLSGRRRSYGRIKT